MHELIERLMKTETQLDQRRRHIFEAALACFIARGFHQTSMREIAQAAGVSLGNLYNHFASKQALIEEIAHAEMDELAQLFDILKQDDSSLAILQFCQQYFGICMQPDYVLLSCEVIAESARSAALAELFLHNRQQLLDCLSDCIKRGTKVAVLAPVVPALSAAQALLDLIEGLAFRSVLACSSHKVATQEMNQLLHIIQGILHVQADDE